MQKMNQSNNFYSNLEKEVELFFLVIVYCLKRPLYIQDEEINKLSYFLSRSLAFLHFIFIVIYQHFKPFKEYMIAIINEFYSVIILKKPSWKSENV